MSKINSAIYEIHCMDDMANKDQWLNRIHPLVKLILTLTYIATVVSFYKYDLTGIIGMAIYPIFLFVVGDISFKDSLRRLRIVLPVVCFVGVFNPIFDREILFSIGEIGISGGFISMSTLMLKGILTVLASYLLIATTTIEKICYAMGLLHIPKMFVTQILFIYRYITVLLTEANRISQAYSLRAPNQKGVHFKVWGSLVGQLLLRSMDRAEDIYESMSIRGYKGESHLPSGIQSKDNNYAYLFIWLIVFGVLKFFPVMEIVGGLFVK
ncbi:MAG TPA: cobalt ECF transporter T component CbiQ [Lachnospiraceae bacterium]|nr:cobalt ECF transporter T component CbiQ [Lachnospiraceae bacterium]